MKQILQECLDKTQRYLHEKLIPFWASHAVEPKYGGYQTNYDRHGQRTDVTEKSMLAQCRAIFTISHAMRLGFSWPQGHEALQQGIDFLFNHFQDREYDGYYWIVEEDGSPKDLNKIIYGHSFLIYGLAEYALLTGNDPARQEAIRVFELLQTKAADPQNGGYLEHFNRQFVPKKARNDIGSHKSLDVHMHLMEAFTTLFELTRSTEHKLALKSVIDLIFHKMVDPVTGTGISMFTEAWVPIPNVELETVWGRDRFDENGKSVDITSYGHNIELAWLYLHAQDILGIPRDHSLDRVVPIYEHTFSRGVDWTRGGLFVEGKKDGKATERTKEFWQQAEGMVGFLDAFETTKNEKYLQAFLNIHEFVFTKMIHWEQGEWFALLDADDSIIWDYMGTSWKVFYHTVRGTCLTVKKLEKIITQL